MLEELSRSYLSQAELNRSCFFALRDIVLAFAPDLTETRKYQLACFCIGKKVCSYLWKDKKTNQPYILFADGKFIDHPALDAGYRKRMKILTVDPTADLPIETIHEVLEIAVNLIKEKSN